MLSNLHVKNIALINEADIDLYPGLNIMSGETGAGKSLLLGSVNLALGAKAGASVVGKDGTYALVELTFTIENENVKKELENKGY